MTHAQAEFNFSTLASRQNLRKVQLTRLEDYLRYTMNAGVGPERLKKIVKDIGIVPEVIVHGPKRSTHLVTFTECPLIVAEVIRIKELERAEAANKKSEAIKQAAPEKAPRADRLAAIEAKLDLLLSYWAPAKQ